MMKFGKHLNVENRVLTDVVISRYKPTYIIFLYGNGVIKLKLNVVSNKNVSRKMLNIMYTTTNP